ncbi:prenyltransferase/squalene oxidase repeat-containing protein [Tundrisphaera lichenicola]|uniref:prenyltransferase/squalene oxidase repeat-containing protein n=1 Tax=Tundrisphaera lichenicola TaxID=2029860 RepID=UPI003EBE8129
MPHARPRWRRLARVRWRRTLSRIDRTAPAWLTWLPSWGTSLLIHAVVLVILATFVFVQGANEEDGVDFDSSIVSLADEDFTSMSPADRSGDPFNTIQTDQTPSLALASADRGTNQRATAGLSFGPNLSMPERPSTLSSSGISDLITSVRMHKEDMTAPFSGRQMANRAQMVRREGGTTASEKAVQEGLNWLMRHQRDDGGWSLDISNECKISPGCPQDVHSESDTAATGLALLPFLGAGHMHNQESRYQDQVARGIDWLISHQGKDGMLYLGGTRHSMMYSHAIASMALCEAYGLSKDPRLKGPAQAAIGFIVQSQNKYDGGWRYEPGEAGDTSVFGWQMFAIRSARLGGLEIPKNVIRGCSHYLDAAGADKHRTTYGYLPGLPAKATMTAEALLCRQYLGWPRDLPAMARGVEGVWNDLQASNERNIYYWYYATQLLHNMQNKAWKQWNPRVRDGLVAMQIGGQGCDRGSWSPIFPQPDLWGTKAGRLFQTSLSVLTLEVYYRFLPLYRTGDATPEDTPKL